MFCKMFHDFVESICGDLLHPFRLVHLSDRQAFPLQNEDEVHELADLLTLELLFLQLLLQLQFEVLVLL